jgi:dissimilatory sulfite reductase (desulfoviridin) alpha/beta subunit
VDSCKEKAVILEEGSPSVDPSRCLACGQCVKVCPTGTLREGQKGYRILLGGKLGRHPRLGQELPGVCDREETLRRLGQCLDFYQQCCRQGERLGDILEREGLARLKVG